MEKIKVDFALHCWARNDTDAKILVGYIPTLRVYSQGHTEEELKKALASAAQMFIVACYQRGIFSNVLKERGMTVSSSHTGAPAAAKGKDGEYIKVAPSEYESSYDRQFTINVPIELIAAQHKAGVECRPR